MDKDALKVLKHIIANNGSGQLTSKKQKKICSALFSQGFIKRRVGDWSWVWTGLDYTDQ